MITQARLHAVLGTFTISMLVLGLVYWQLSSDPKRGALLGVALMPVIWGVVAVMLRRRALIAFGEYERRYFVAMVLVAGFILVISMGLSIARAVVNDDLEIARRAWGALAGLALVLAGNYLPKALRPLIQRRCSAVETQSVQRFAGWVIAIAGLGYIGAWLALPMDRAAMVSDGFCLAAVVLVAMRWASGLSRSRAPPSS